MVWTGPGMMVGKTSPTSLLCTCWWGTLVLWSPGRSQASSPAASSVHTAFPTGCAFTGWGGEELWGWRDT